MADRLERLCALAQWLQNQKGKIGGITVMCVCPSQLNPFLFLAGTHAAADKTAVADYGDAGFGFQATESIEKGEVLCLIPLQLVRAERPTYYRGWSVYGPAAAGSQP